MASILSGIFGAIGANNAGNIDYKAGTTAQKNIENQIASGQSGVNAATGAANTNVNAATGLATGDVNAATGAANTNLAGVNAGEQSNLSPYLSAGASGATGLQNYAASNPQFSFAPTQQQLENTPGYKFQLAQGTNAIQNTNAAEGLNQSGAAQKELTQYGQGLAGTYYQNAFNNAQSTFNTNQNATLANLSTLANIGTTATGQSNSAAQNAGNQEAANTTGAGVYSGNANINAQQYLGSLNTQAGESNAALGVQGETAAGNDLLTGAEGKAVGTAGMFNGIGQAAGGGLDAILAGGF